MLIQVCRRAGEFVKFVSNKFHVAKQVAKGVVGHEERNLCIGENAGGESR